MANLKEVRIRIGSVTSTQQITKAMKLVSATKLRKAQGAITQMRPYANKLKSILGNLSGSVDHPSLSAYFEQKEAKNVLLVVITSDRGLCGAFNSNIIKKTNNLLATKYAEQHAAGKVTLLCVGKKGYDYFRKTDINIINTFVSTLTELNAENGFAVAEYVLDEYRAGKYDVVDIIYNEFKNAATQIRRDEQMLPVFVDDLAEGESSNNDYIFEPSKVEILEELIPRTLKTQLYSAMLDSVASEHGARMISMDKATENAGEMLKSLRIEYNKARQAAITQEISEIVGGAAALG